MRLSSLSPSGISPPYSLMMVSSSRISFLVTLRFSASKAKKESSSFVPKSPSGRLSSMIFFISSVTPLTLEITVSLSIISGR